MRPPEGQGPPGSGPSSSSSGPARASISSSIWRRPGPSSCRSTSASTRAGVPISALRRGIRCEIRWARSLVNTGSVIGGRSSSHLPLSPSSFRWASERPHGQSPHGLFCGVDDVDTWAEYHPQRVSTPSTTPSEITCLIVDDHEVVREGLRLSLSRAPHIRVIGEASDGASAVALAERRKPNVVIMDVRMPGMDGLEATKILTEKVPESAVLIFTAYSERSLLGRGLESGAKGYILKEAPHQTLLRAIEKVAGGEGYVDPALMPAFLTGKDKDEMLTSREREILQLLADGMSNADVAGKLFISQETVKSHVRHILAKLEADTRTHAVAIALREAIID